MKRFVVSVLIVVVVLTFFVVSVVWADDGYPDFSPYNGSFELGRTGWTTTSGWGPACDVLDGVGLDSSRALKLDINYAYCFAHSYTSTLTVANPYFVVAARSSSGWILLVLERNGVDNYYEVNLGSTSSWVTKSVSVSGWSVGDKVRVKLAASYWGQAFFDHAVFYGTVSDYSVPTATPVGGGGVYPTIDWSQFPTSQPFPTLVQVTFGNTPQPVYLTTPIVFPTPLYGAGTPVPITNPTPRVTAIASGGRSDLVSVGSVSRSYNTGGLSGVIPVNVAPGGSASDLNGVAVEERPFSICLPNEISQIINLPQACWNISIYSVTGWKIAGIDLIPAFSLVLVALFIVFIIRQVQEK